MIRYERNIAAPEVLNEKFGGRKFKGMTEQGAVLAEFKRQTNRGILPIDFKFSYSRYKHEKVKKALRLICGDKCAYCESVYVGIQPMDVEHWRPKGKVIEGGEVLPGYYWLAADWDNLYPSCIDCNRSRTQVDAFTNEMLALGKANQFPIAGTRVSSPDEQDLTVEQPLLIDPFSQHPDEDPETFFTYTDEAVILPKEKSGIKYERAKASIRVYALNRADLVNERFGVRKLVNHRLELIRRLVEIRTRLGLPETDSVYHALSDLIFNEVTALLEMQDSHRPYAGMVREMVKTIDPTLDSAQ